MWLSLIAWALPRVRSRRAAHKEEPIEDMFVRERLRTLLEYRGSFNRFDLRISKAQADGLAQLFFRVGEPRQPMASGGARRLPSA